MKKIIVGLAGLVIILLPSEIAFGFGRGGSYSGSRGNVSSTNRYGGSTSHSYGSTNHSNAYGGSTSHTAGQGTTHDSAYGTSTSTMKAAEARLTRTPMAGKRRVNTGKARLTQTPMAALLRLNTGRARRIRTFTVGPLLALMVKARTTPAPMVTALRIIRQPLIMAIIRLPRSTTTDRHAPTATVGRPLLLSQPPPLLVRLSLQQMQTLPTLMLRPRQPTLTTLDTTPARPRVNLPRPRQPRLRHQATIPWDRWLARSRLVALLPPSKARPTICVAIPGSARPTAQTAFTIAWCLVPAASRAGPRSRHGCLYNCGGTRVACGSLGSSPFREKADEEAFRGTTAATRHPNSMRAARVVFIVSLSTPNRFC